MRHPLTVRLKPEVYDMLYYIASRETEGSLNQAVHGCVRAYFAERYPAKRSDTTLVSKLEISAK